MLNKVSTAPTAMRCLRLMLTAFFITSTGLASGEPVLISSYDIDQTPVSGFGCWFHNFTGTITDTGRTVGGSGICSSDGIGHVLQYAGGSGTLNDGAFDTTHLLLTRNADDGLVLQPVIRLHL